MPKYTPVYNLGYLSRGSLYSEYNDYKRFVTLDYNLESYVGIVGVGVINGWTIEKTNTPLTIQILPGTGMINGFYSESEYEFIQRSDMTSGYREVEIVQDDNIPESQLTASQRATYISIRQEYEPSYYNPDPGTPITNYYIKAVFPETMTLPDNSDWYIFAVRKFEDPSTCWTSGTLPPVIGDKPISSSYTSYKAYKIAIDAYNIALAAMRQYQWRTYVANHFTSVEFTKSVNYIKSSEQTLIGKVITRNGIVKKIDVSQVDSLANLDASIKEKSKPYIAGHHHGGNNSFDPIKVNLKTDIRHCALSSYDSNGQVSTFDILENTETDINVGHKHTYKIDSSGNGYTVDILGTSTIHFHNIIEFVVQNQEFTENSIQTHVHTIPTTIETIDPDSQYVIYINGVPATRGVTADLTTKKINVYGLMGEIYKTYYSSFDVQVKDLQASTASQDVLVTETYTFQKSSPNVLSFMLSMESDFNNEYVLEQLITIKQATTEISVSSTMPLTQSDIESSIDTYTNSRHPFVFVENGKILDANDLFSQSSIAQELLKNEGDEFVFTPNAARNISILLKTINSTSNSDYEVKIEILGNTEINGVLRDESIVYVNTEKFKLGIFDIARVPPLNHIGRMGEEFLPFQYPLISTDGVIYTVSPSITTIKYNHYHQLHVDNSISGSTHNTYISEDPVHYAYSNNTSYLIAHGHVVHDGTVIPSTARDLVAWQKQVYDVIASNVHSHSITYPLKGDPKIIYSLAETADHSILAGTSMGMYIIPSDNAYLFVINEVPIYQIGTDLWNSLLKSKAEYESQTGKTLIVTEELYYDYIANASETLITDGDSILMKGYIDPINGQDEIMLQKVTSFLLPHFRYSKTMPLNQVSEEDTVISVKLVYDDGTFVTQADIDAAIEAGADAEDALLGETVEMATVEKNLQNVPIWSIVTDSNGYIYTCGSTVYSKNLDIESNLYSDWSDASKPAYCSPLKKAYKDSKGNVWFSSESGLLIARYYQNGEIIEATNNPDISVKINDVVEGLGNKIYTATNLGINVTSNYGKTWTTVFNSDGCAKILKDDSTNKLYAITNNYLIYSSDNGTVWNSIGTMSQQEFGDILMFNNAMYICTANGLYRNQGASSSWEKVMEEVPYSLCALLDGSGILVGCNQNIYISLDGITYMLVVSLDGSAAPSLYTNDARKTYGYAFGNKNQQFFFKETIYTENYASSLVDFNTWMAKDGTWDSSAPIDIYIDRKLIYSSKKDIDNRVESNYLFNINPEQGMIDFSAKTTLEKTIEVYDGYISVSNSSGFAIGDRVYIVCTATGSVAPDINTNLSGLLTYLENLTTYYKTLDEFNNMYLYAEITEVSSGKLFLDRKSDKTINIPASVYKIPNLSGSTSIFTNIYSSPLSNIGKNTHEDLDDKITYMSDNRPYQLNNSYLSNLLQLTQAIKYVYPDIDEYITNTKLFDFKYSWNPSDPDLPYIGDIIDLYNSEVFNEGLYNSQFTSSKARMVNKILIGHGTFDNTIIVGTDIGIFYAKESESLEYNWFYTHNLRFPVYDLLISTGDTLLAATNMGVYETTDLLKWNQYTQTSISFPVYTLSYRWKGKETVFVDSHTATFSNSDGQGYIDSATPIYGSIEAGRIIKVYGVDTEPESLKNGNYSVASATDYQIIIVGEFEGNTVVYNGCKIEMGAWWEYLDSDTSTNNPNMNNTLIAGGRSMIAFATNVASGLTSNEIIWRQGELPSDLLQFATSSVTPLSNGIALASISGTNNLENNILKCSGSGQSWSHFKNLTNVKGTIISKQPTKTGHTTVKVQYSFPNEYVAEDYTHNLKEIGFFHNDQLVLKSYVLSNENRHNYDYITIYGQDIIEMINLYSSLTFTIYPIKINKIVETYDHNVLFATDNGVYKDDGSIINLNQHRGEIVKVGVGGTVTAIDVEGTINSISSISNNAYTNKVVLNITNINSVSANKLVGMNLYIVDYNTPLEYVILSNTSVGVNGEVSITIDAAYNSNWNINKNKKIVVVGSKSKVYITFDSPVLNDQFNGGKLYVSSGENIGKTYTIVSNTNEYVIVNEAIPPKSTMAINNDSLYKWQTVKLVDSTGRIKLYVILYEDADLNQFAGQELIMEETSGFSVNTLSQSMTIYSNTPYELVLNPITVESSSLPPILLFAAANAFVISGNNFLPVQSFNNTYLYESEDHYHGASLLNQKLKGTIDTIISSGSSYMDITISNSTGFDNAILLTNGDIIDGCKVILFNPLNMAYSYETTSVSYIGGILKLRVDNNLWNTVSYEETKISPTWKFFIESKYSGISSGTYYNDFAVIKRYLTADIINGETLVSLDSTSDIYNGDKIEIFDATGKTFISYVSNIISPTQLQLNTVSDNSFLVINSSGIKVLRDAFTNNHTHKIYDTQAETLVILDYVELGYISSHSHKLTSYISDVSDLAIAGEWVLAVGSSKNVYVSYDNGLSWNFMINLNGLSLEWIEEISGISRVIYNGSQLIVGTTNGQIFSNTNKGWANVPLEEV